MAHSTFKSAGNLMAKLEAMPREDRHCDKHGDYQSMKLDSGKWSSCPDCRDAEDMRQARNEIAAGSIEKRLEACGIPPRFHDMDFSTYEVGQKEKRQESALRACQGYAGDIAALKRGACLLLIGKKGTGKTHLACSIVRQAIQQHDMSAKYIAAHRMFRRIKETYGKNTQEAESQVIADYASTGLLVIDEIGMNRGTDTEMMALYDIINDRYEHRRPTVIVSNIADAAELEQWLGERTMDRLREDGKAIGFNWDSIRGKNN